MDVPAALDLVRTSHRAVLSTFRADGWPQLSPVSAAVDAEDRVVISTREPAIKVANLRRDPRASLCVITERWYGQWAQLEGTAQIVSLPEAMELLVDYYRRARGEHRNWDEYRQAMRDQKRVLLQITITRAGPTVSG